MKNVILLVILCLLFNSCSSANKTYDVNSVYPSDKSNTKSNNNITEQKDSNVNNPVDKELDNSYADCELSDELAIKIATNCFFTLSVEFQENDEIPYSDVFPYFMYDGCYTDDRKGILIKLIQYYDRNSGRFSIPYEIVDNFLIKKFNTTPDRFAVEWYNQQTECYEFTRHDGELFYDIVLYTKEKLDNYANRYMFTVKISHNLTDTIPVQYHTYVIEFTDNDYKILSRTIN